MTREEAIDYNKNLRMYMRLSDKNQPCKFLEENYIALEMAIKALEIEPLTDTEQRIFYAAMGREEKICREVCKDGDGVDLVAVCHSIERKVKKALWE